MINRLRLAVCASWQFNCHCVTENRRILRNYCHEFAHRLRHAKCVLFFLIYWLILFSLLDEFNLLCLYANDKCNTSSLKQLRASNTSPNSDSKIGGWLNVSEKNCKYKCGNFIRDIWFECAKWLLLIDETSLTKLWW